ncbi:MAG: hypothetical protein U9N02_05165 [Campylobacterota bacterium]|nr:hypothetical protein [Campylobacterota bacterium]
MLTKFLQLFNPYPGSHYMQVTSLPDDTTHALANLLDGIGEFSLAFYGDKIDETEFKNTNIKYIKNMNQPFQAMPRSNDIIILKDIFASHENQDMLLKLSYSSLANTADIIIMEKKGVMDIEAIKIMLDDYEFRAVNDIDIVDGYDLIMAKKMHMWGNGL